MGAGGSGSYAERVAQGKLLLKELFPLMEDGKCPDLECLRGVPGVNLEPTTWAELAKLVADGGVAALGRLGRSPLQLKQYEEYMVSVRARYASVTDYLHAKVFGLPAAPGPGAGVKRPGAEQRSEALGERRCWFTDYQDSA